VSVVIDVGYGIYVTVYVVVPGVTVTRVMFDASVTPITVVERCPRAAQRTAATPSSDQRP
jgi:hypothetical protein